MTATDNLISVRDIGVCVEITAACECSIESLDVCSTTTQLVVRDSSGHHILNVPQLYSTVDASRTRTAVSDGVLTITLHKLSPKQAWPFLEPEEVTHIYFFISRIQCLSMQMTKACAHTSFTVQVSNPCLISSLAGKSGDQGAIQ